MRFPVAEILKPRGFKRSGATREIAKRPAISTIQNFCSTLNPWSDSKFSTFIAKQIPFNEQIKARELRVIDETGENLGVLGRDEAIAKAKAKGLALIEVNPTADPPVAKIVDYGKFIYEQQKNERKARAHQKAQELKQIQIKYKTSSHDLGIKANRVKKFLDEGHRVRLEIFLRGREKGHRDMARERLQEFVKMIETICEGQLRTIEEMHSSPRGFITTVAK